MSTSSFSPIYVRNAANKAFPKNPEINILILKFFCELAVIPPNTESKAAKIAIATYDEYCEGIWIGVANPIIRPRTSAINNIN